MAMESRESVEKMPAGQQVRKRPAGQKEMLAIMHKDDEPVAKRPAAKISIMKKPVAAASKGDKGPPDLTDETVAKQNKEANEQNDKLNLCMKQAVRSLADQTMDLLSMESRLKNVESSGTAAKMNELIVQESESLRQKVDDQLDKIKAASVRLEEVKFTDQKVEMLKGAADLIDECKQLLQGEHKNIHTQAVSSDAASKKS